MTLSELVDILYDIKCAKYRNEDLDENLRDDLMQEAMYEAVMSKELA